MELTAALTLGDDGPGSEFLIASDTIGTCNNTELPNGRGYLRGQFNCELYDGPNPAES